jgi:lipopolysaccharide export system protein LptA
MRVPFLLLLVATIVGLRAPTAAAQGAPGTRVVTIVNADSVAGAVVDGERVRRLIGRVHLRQDTTDLRAQRATQYLDRDLIVFEGNVEIADPTDTLRARRVSYDSVRRIGRAQGNVRLADAESVLYSDSLTFFRTERRAVFQSPVRLVEREGGGVLTSRRGTYFTDRKEAFFEQDVRLEDESSILTSHFGRYGTEDKRADFRGDVRLEHQRSTRLRADSLTHFRDTEISEARGNVAVLRLGGRNEPEAGTRPDTTRRTLLFGGYAFHDEGAEYSRVESGGHHLLPLVARLTTDSLGVTDTLLVRSRQFEAFQLNAADGRSLPDGATLQRVVGRGEVQLAGARLAAVADSLVFDRLEFEAAVARPVEDDIRLYQSPMAWMNELGSTVYTQLSGDTIQVRGHDEAIDSLRAIGRAFVVRPDSALERNNQMRGQQLLALFRDDSLRAIHVWPSAEAVFFRADSLGQLEGATRVSADSMAFAFLGDELRRVGVYRGVEGTHYPASVVPNPLRLDGPEFDPERRPSRERLLENLPPLDDPFAAPRPPAAAPPPGPDPMLPDTLMLPPVVTGLDAVPVERIPSDEPSPELRPTPAALPPDTESRPDAPPDPRHAPR